MVVPNPRASNRALQNAIFDYLNLNRHKFDALGEFDPTPDERDYVPPELVKYQPGPAGQYEAAGVEADEAWQEDLSHVATKAGTCATEVWPEVGIAAGLIGLGAGTIRKPFVLPRSSPRTSIASKYLAPLIPGKFRDPVWALTFRKPFAAIRSIGRVITRWIPGIGWAMLAYDAYKLGDCMIREGGDPDVGT